MRSETCLDRDSRLSMFFPKILSLFDFIETVHMVSSGVPYHGFMQKARKHALNLGEIKLCLKRKNPFDLNENMDLILGTKVVDSGFLA